MSYATHDTALGMLRGTGPELRNGAPNHASMVVEALAALGHGDRAPDWVTANSLRLAQGPQTNAVLDGDWSKALGDFGKLGEWQNLFGRELARAPWRDVVNCWLPRLIPGSMAAGTHGIIRCGHAVRALENRETAPRLEELAHALAYCAARYHAVAAMPPLTGDLDIECAVKSLPLLDPDMDRSGPPPRVVKLLSSRKDFFEAIQRLTPPADPVTALTALSEIGARCYLRDASRHPLVLLHAMTGPAAVQLLLRHASGECAVVAFSYMWQAVAVWAAAFSSGPPVQAPRRLIDRSWDELVDRAVAGGDDHAIKLVEACQRQESLCDSTAFRAAAKDWIDRLEASRGKAPAELVAAGIRTRLPGN